MNDIVRNVNFEIKQLKSKGYLRTGDIRKLSAKLYRGLQDKSINNVFIICESLLEQRNWAMGVIAYDFAYRVKEQYDENTFAIFEHWLIKYVKDWGDCDDFCTHAFGELITQNTSLVEKIIPWTNRDEFWVRRAASVVLIPSIKHNKYNETKPLEISSLLMRDSHYLVCKGYGWMLKVLSMKEPQLVYDYLIENKDAMPRVSFRYALEKLDYERKTELMNL